jgi:predicted Fe-S protein YdhL (DUF1289 family)
MASTIIPICTLIFSVLLRGCFGCGRTQDENRC